MDRNIQADLEEYRKQKAQSGVAPLTTPTGTRNIAADLEAYRAKKNKPKTYAERSAEMQSQGQAVATKGRFNRTGEITPSMGGNIIRGIARIPVEGALTVARGFGGLGSEKIRENGLTVKSKFLGDTKDYATSVEDTAKELADRVNKGEISKGRAVVGVLGASAEKALDLASVVPAGDVLSAGKTAVAQGAKGVTRESLKSATKTALKRSGTLAGGYDIAQQAKEGNGYNPLRTAGAIALGTVADVGISNVLPRVVSPRKKTVDEEIRKIFEGTTGDVAKIDDSAFRAKKGLELLIKESKDIEIPDSKAPLGSGATKAFDIKNSKPNGLLSGVLEMDKKITARAREATQKAKEAGLRINVSSAEAKIQRAIDTGEVPKAAGERMLRQIRETNGDPVKIHDWVQDVNIKYKKKYERGTIEDTLTGKTADDIAETFRSELDTIVDRKGYAEAFGNNQELKRMLVAIAKKANKQVNFGDISTEAGLDAAISILTGNPAYMARTVGTTLFKGLISRSRNKSGIKALKRSIKKQSKLPTSQKLPSGEVKPQKPILQLPAGNKDAPRIRIESGRTINLPKRTQSTADAQSLANLKAQKIAPPSNIPSKVSISKTIPEKKTKPKLSLKDNRGFIATGYKETGNLTTKILKDLEGKTTVSKQYILDATNRGELKQVERDLIRDIVSREGDTVNVSDFAKKVKAELLPLDIRQSYIQKGKFSQPEYVSGGFTPAYENVTLPDELRGNIASYQEHIFESPIKTSAGDVHFGSSKIIGGTDNYFGHTRIEDMADNKTRRVIEVQSDLYQKGNLEQELPHKIDYSYLDASKIKQKPNNGLFYVEDKSGTPIKFAETKAQLIKDLSGEFDKKELKRIAEVKKLQQYNDPTAHFRMIREEIKKAAQDGKTKLQFPTGETAMKIEGLVNRSDKWVTLNNELITDGSNIKVGDLITFQVHEGGIHPDRRFLITKNNGNGTFRAVDSLTAENDGDFYNFLSKKGLLDDGRMPTFEELDGVVGFDDEMIKRLDELAEDLSAKDTVDTDNPIYKFYEKDVQKYLNKYGGKRVVDDKGVSWIEVPIKKEYGKAPVEAFGKSTPNVLLWGAGLSLAGVAGAGAIKKRKNGK